MRDKAVAKVKGHNLTVRTVQRVTQLVPRQLDSGTAYRYETYARQYSCGRFSCRVKREQRVRVIVDYRVLSDNYYYGVVTGYCPGRTNGDCPSWVNTHIN